MHAMTIPTAGEHASGLEDAQVATDRRLSQFNPFREFADRQLLMQQNGDHPQTIRMGERPQAITHAGQIDACKRIARRTWS